MEYHSGGSLPLLGRPRYCPGANANGGYLCETGHCCGETGCCTYYYELWWFWLLWTFLILFSCCCAYRHRRAKLRVQQQQRQREISLLAYHGANSYPSSMLDLSFLASLKLPSYEEVAAQPSTPPPPYSSVFTTPRYPQPPRAADPHLLTQHGPLLHRPLSDGPSSLSSDNSSSCSCDSCCPSSPCSSSLSAPVTYETDTSHASTPSEAAPLTLDVTIETITAAATCLEVNETPSEGMVSTVAIDIDNADAAAAQEPGIAILSVPNQTVTVAVVTRAASPQSLPSPGSEVVLSVGATSPIKQQLDLAPCSPTLPDLSVVNTTLPTNQMISSEGLAEGPFTQTTTTSNSLTATQTLDTLSLTRTFDTANNPCNPTAVPSQKDGRTLALITGSAGGPTHDPNPSLVPIPAPLNLTQVSVPVPTNLTQASVPVPTSLTPAPDPIPSNFTPPPNPDPPSNLTQASDPLLSNLTQAPDPAPSEQTQSSASVPTTLTQVSIPGPSNLNQSPVLPPSNLTQTLVLVPSNPSQASVPLSNTTLVPDYAPIPNPTLKPAQSNLTLGTATDTAPKSPTLTPCQNPELSPVSGLALSSPSPRSGLPQHPEAVAGLVSCLHLAAIPAISGPSLVLPQSQESDLISQVPSDVQAGFSSALTPASSSPSSSCPAITIESASSFAPSHSPSAALSPSSKPSHRSTPYLCSPPAVTSTSPPAPALLLDPLTALHQSEKGGSSSGHASSLSPSPRATQSPPKQTLFSPCVDVFEPGPPSWDEGEEQEVGYNEDDEEEDMGADESQYRHRRLTGDSGIEVCRCRVEEEDEDEEDEEEEEEKKADRRGGVAERDKKGSGNTDFHDSMDCPARSQITTGEGLTLCNPTATISPTSEESGEVVIVMETV